LDRAEEGKGKGEEGEEVVLLEKNGAVSFRSSIVLLVEEL
jgi:hypothetical protein